MISHDIPTRMVLNSRERMTPNYMGLQTIVHFSTVADYKLAYLGPPTGLNLISINLPRINQA